MSKRPHPAAFPPAIINVLRDIVPPGTVLDPFAGTGRIGQLNTKSEAFELFVPPPKWRIVAVELEAEWISQARDNGCDEAIQGDSRHLPFPDETFDAVVTSPTYGCRLSDNYMPTEEKLSDATRRSYKIYLGRALTSGNSGALKWGDEYRALHRDVWKECHRVLQPGGKLIVNVKDHIKNGERQNVVDWHRACIETLGFRLIDRIQVALAGDQNTNRMRKQGKQTVDYEEILVFEK